MIDFYCGIAESSWSGLPAVTGGQICISPRTGKSINRITLPSDTHSVLQDSGAFQTDIANRLSFEGALEQQVEHAEKYNYAHLITYRVAYDILIDEVWQEGVRTKRRWSLQDAEYAVSQTVKAAEYLSKNRHDLNLCLPVQGVNAEQYMRCAMPIIDLLDIQDMLGLGGWCIIGKMPSRMMPIFTETIQQLIPYAAKQGVKRVHIFGVIFPAALGQLLYLANDYGISVSTDSTSPQRHPITGNWGYGEWRDNSYKHLKRKGIDLGQDRIKHVALTRAWLAEFEKTRWHKAPNMYIKPRYIADGHYQLTLF